MIAEIVGGYIANSLALYTDAGHLLLDVGSLCLSLFAQWLAKRPSTTKMSFGFHRAEILGAIVSALSIWLLSGFLIYAAVERIQDPEDVTGLLVMCTAIFGLVANVTVAWILHGSSGHNINVRSAFVHVIGDCIQSIGVIVAGLVMYLEPTWTLVDPIVTMVFAILVLFTTFRLIIESVTILMEATPPGVNPGQVMEDLQSIPNVDEVHDLHIWSITAGLLSLSVHLTVRLPQDDIKHGSEVLEQAQKMLTDRHKISHTTIQIEFLAAEQGDRKECTYGGIH